MAETRKIWVVGKRRIDDTPAGVPVELEEDIADYYVKSGIAEKAPQTGAPTGDLAEPRAEVSKKTSAPDAKDPSKKTATK